jgi:hypothetical protein
MALVQPQTSTTAVTVVPPGGASNPSVQAGQPFTAMTPLSVPILPPSLPLAETLRGSGDGAQTNPTTTSSADTTAANQQTAGGATTVAPTAGGSSGTLEDGEEVENA